MCQVLGEPHTELILYCAQNVEPRNLAFRVEQRSTHAILAFQDMHTREIIRQMLPESTDNKVIDRCLKQVPSSHRTLLAAFMWQVGTPARPFEPQGSKETYQALCSPSRRQEIFYDMASVYQVELDRVINEMTQASVSPLPAQVIKTDRGQDLFFWCVKEVANKEMYSDQTLGRSMHWEF